MLKYENKYNLDDKRTTLLHRDIILHKKFLKKIYQHWYNIFSNESKTIPLGPSLEIGSGGGFIKEIMHQVITSDVQPLEHCDKCFSADKIPFEEKELSAIYMINVFHHLPKPIDFLKEADRTLKMGGKIIMIEPANSIWGRFVYKNFHHELFDSNGGWEINSSGPLSGANGALPWIVFQRDKNQFKRLFPNLHIHSIKFEMPFLYLLSGGVSRKSFVPESSFDIFKMIEKILSPFSKYLSMFQVIVIVKT
jgi:SAM-dependent methyltransferase